MELYLLLVMVFVGACALGAVIADAVLPPATVEKIANSVFRL